MRTLPTAIIVVLTLTASGCAARSGHFPQADRLFRPGVQKADGERPAKPPQDSLETHVSKVRALMAEVRPVAKPDGVRSIERTDSELSEALLVLSVAPAAESHRRVAEAYRRAGVLDLSYRHFAAATRLDPSDAAAWDGLARTWRDWGFPHLGLGDAHRAIYHAPRAAAPVNTLGTLLQAMGHSREARTRFEQALRLDPQASYALNNLCCLSLEEGDQAAAIASCQHAVALEPGLTEARYNLARAYATAGNLDTAAREFQAAGGGAAAQYNLGLVRMAQGRYSEAADAFGRAAVLRPGDRAAVRRALEARRLALEQSADGGGHERH